MSKHANPRLQARRRGALDRLTVLIERAPEMKRPDGSPCYTQADLDRMQSESETLQRRLPS